MTAVTYLTTSHVVCYNISMIQRMRYLILPLLAFMLFACTPAVKQVPTPNRIAMAGDSVIWQSMLYGGNYDGYDVDQKVYPGWRAVHAQPRVTQDVATVGTSPEVLVIEFGHNYATFGADQRNEVTALAFSPHVNTCVVLVKPHPAPHNTAVINAYRAHVDSIDAARANTVAVDWSPIVQAHPEYLDEDGVHLNVPPWEYGVPDQPAAVAFSDMINAGIATCP